MEQINAFQFSEGERDSIKYILQKISVNPYTDYEGFEMAVDSLLANGAIPKSFTGFCVSQREKNTYENPYVMLYNCPIDDELPLLNFDEPVIDKRNRKKKYVSEGFLLLYAKLMKQEPIGYTNVNDGDIFQDIHPKRDLVNSQSQKALKPIFFHKDLANHFVRPDWVNILGLRASTENEVYTSFARNKDVLAMLDESICDILRSPLFYTPYDDLTTYKSATSLGTADAHPILGGAKETDLRFFENRTRGLTDEACTAVSKVIEALREVKTRIVIGPGDFVGAANNDCLHNKEFGEIRDDAALEERWLMKTVNVRSLEDHDRHFVEGQHRIVNG